ncbi:g13462 [Coccomyxa viridis]|uniref:Methionyl-tRNA formyltransferase, mitochondrial n=1 Tax=Coccomyxa viridis TaxID=1274662 RepID=A0ABP1GHH6_9CHLO
MVLKGFSAHVAGECDKECLITARGAGLRCYASSSENVKHRVVFLGTPEVAASVLQQLHAASSQDCSTFQIVAVVTQPGRPRGRGNKAAQPSIVAEKATALGYAEEQILSPVKASEGEFLSQLAGLQPDLCITAAYGNILPQKFLDIPRFGTLNIHPSLLPKYRGASPVQRALQDGVAETGVSVAFTVRAMDAGPILAQEHVTVDDAIQAPELLDDLFRRGTELLIRNLPLVWDGRARHQALPQDEAAVSHASKIKKSEGQLDFREGARALHNKVRAFAGWPGTAATFQLEATASEVAKSLGVKITRTCVTSAAELDTIWSAKEDRTEVCVVGDRLVIPCTGGDCLEVLELQPTGKKQMPAGAFINGLKGRRVFIEH